MKEEVDQSRKRIYSKGFQYLAEGRFTIRAMRPSDLTFDFSLGYTDDLNAALLDSISERKRESM